MFWISVRGHIVKIAGIQYLRAIAAIGVVIAHAAGMASFDKYFGVKPPLYDFLSTGTLGVPLFFGISGFIIIVSSTKAGSLEPKKGFREYLFARCVRILPMMWLAIGSYAALRFLGRGSFDLIPYINASLLLPFGNFEPNNIWTLRHEAMFYLVFGLSFLLSRRLWPMLVAWLTAPVLLALAGSPLSVESNSIVEQSLANFFSVANVFFGGGVLAGVAYRKYHHVFEKVSASSFGHAQRWWILAILFALSMLLFDSRSDATNNILHIAIFFTATIFVGALEGKSFNKYLYYIGNASYAIYLFHPHVQSATLGILAKLVPSLHIVAVIVIVSIVSTLAGCIIYSFVEKPLTTFLHRKISARGNIPPPAPIIVQGTTA
ncbi:MAG: hypothetical protein CVT76_01765 [Alphaproteobacteria bacterium HGW-Alphaproteobacteria-15]|nr:MAG: hypothetical protein CVT76_01765 [Alphaproteobacteria bacterium HGW-Alphaproteobacteria-15]